MRLQAVTEQDVEQARLWRNENLVPYRTPFFLTEEMQKEFYLNVVCNRKADHRYYSVYDGDKFIALIGLVNISWENRNAEISIVVNPKFKHHGYGRKSLRLLLSQGFNSLNLENIYGESYSCNADIEFWIKTIKEYDLKYTSLPARKFANGSYHDSIYFNFNRGNLK